ncbi:helix-turn-helix domain-containing protein [Sorangium sp. KYC3313]|uniref:helix-turn-helix domain-containing protein n=1 Tax=Sorangium sp. KYC3313 TaxID=3449740 RepID=UPI003F89F2C0
MSTRGALRLGSIEQIHGLIGRPPPAHPLVSVIAASWQEPLRIEIPIIGRPIESGLYVISLKRGDECHAEFGRQVHDGQAGIIVFASPGQVITPIGGESELAHEGEGWTVVFHPDVLRDTPLSDAMHQYRFFGYATHEALHLTRPERETFTGLVRQLERESSVPPDAFAPDVLSAQLQLLFTYCQRAYARQLEVRARAASAVAYALGFEHPQHFSKLFRQKTGQSPGEWRRGAQRPRTRRETSA